MMSGNRLTLDDLLHAMTTRASDGQAPVSSSELAEATGASLATVKRMLAKLVALNLVEASGKARATRYRLTDTPSSAAIASNVAREPDAQGFERARPRWSAASIRLRQQLLLPMGARTPAPYRRDFVDQYKPNESTLLPAPLADELFRLGRLPGQMPAGTYARKVLEQLLIDLSWSSSHLEGNRYTLLDTEELFRSGAAASDGDAVMLLNHKAAIEFLVDAVPAQGLTAGLLRNLHAVLMQDLLAEVGSLGAIREKVVNISGTVYVPMQVPAVLAEMFGRICDAARQIKNPVEAAFFLWVNLAYLQPFEDGNKRVSRLAANIPLMLYNQAPLSFLDVDREDYALAMMGVYEFRDVSMAVDLFAWTYRRSQARYKVVQESMTSPDPFRIKYRESLIEAVRRVVRGRRPLADAVLGLGLPEDDLSAFSRLVAQELTTLAEFNCARYRLAASDVQAWIAEDRPLAPE